MPHSIPHCLCRKTKQTTKQNKAENPTLIWRALYIPLTCSLVLCNSLLLPHSCFMPSMHTATGATSNSPRFLGFPTFSAQRRQQGLGLQYGQVLPDGPIYTDSVIIINNMQKELLSCQVFFTAQTDAPCFLQGHGSCLDTSGEQTLACTCQWEHM